MGTQEGAWYERRTFVNKTGVAHFTLQFWQLNKTDLFCMSVLQYF